MSDTRIKALIGFSDGEISLGVNQIADVDSTKASAWISAGIAAAYTDPVVPSGSVTLDANGTYDVSGKATAVVDVTVKTVTYNVNGGSGTVEAVTAINGNTISLNDGSGITPPTNKAFIGWATTSDAETPDVTSPYTVTSDVTLYAVYQVVAYTVTYNVNGGTGTVDPVTVSVGQSVSLDDGSGITAPAETEFKGWATTDSALEPDVTSPYTPEADVTLYAVYGAA